MRIKKMKIIDEKMMNRVKDGQCRPNIFIKARLGINQSKMGRG